MDLAVGDVAPFHLDSHYQRYAAWRSSIGIQPAPIDRWATKHYSEGYGRKIDPLLIERKPSNKAEPSPDAFSALSEL